MRSALKFSLLSAALMVFSGSVLASECPDSSASAPAPQAQASPAPAVGNYVYLNPYDLIRAQEAMMNQEFNAMNAMWVPMMAPMMAPAPIGFALPNPIQSSGLVKTANGYQLRVDVPGFKPEDVHVQLNGRALNISASQQIDKQYKVGNTPEQGVSERSFSETILLPQSVDSNGMVQKVQDGVLTIQFPNSAATSSNNT